MDTWQRNHHGLWTRLGGRHRTRFDDQSGELNEFLAHDRAIDLLAESVRLFQQVRYRAVCDPRVRLYDTVAVPDELNGDGGRRCSSSASCSARPARRSAGRTIARRKCRRQAVCSRQYAVGAVGS